MVAKKRTPKKRAAKKPAPKRARKPRAAKAAAVDERPAYLDMPVPPLPDEDRRSPIWRAIDWLFRF